jgi:ADP-heptose:LPS heptosyltransferase
MKILIVRLSSIGDCVLASPVVEALRDRYPEAEITWAVQSKSVSVVRGLPGLVDTLVWDDRKHRVRELARTLWQVRRSHYDITLDLQGLDKAGVFLRASGSPRRVSGTTARRISRWSANEMTREPKEPIHAREFYLRRASQLDIAPDAAARFFPQVPITSLHRRFANEFLAHADFGEDHRIIGLNLGAAHAIKQWPATRFAQLADALLREDERARVLVFGAPADAPLLEQFETELAKLEQSRRQMGTSGKAASNVIAPGDAWRGRVLVAVGRVDLMQLAALSERCSAFVTGDTGPMHIVAAVGAPIVALFGPTSVARTGPVQKPDGAPIRVLDGQAISGLPRPSMEMHGVEAVRYEIAELLRTPHTFVPPRNALFNMAQQQTDTEFMPRSVLHVPAS